jgi:hypothetical protein
LQDDVGDVGGLLSVDDTDPQIFNAVYIQFKIHALVNVVSEGMPRNPKES